ncbi:hypothetical protein ACS0TY_024420 [Phlomoides rotata]
MANSGGHQHRVAIETGGEVRLAAWTAALLSTTEQGLGAISLEVRSGIPNLRCKPTPYLEDDDVVPPPLDRRHRSSLFPRTGRCQGIGIEGVGSKPQGSLSRPYFPAHRRRLKRWSSAAGGAHLILWSLVFRSSPVSQLWISDL